MSPSHNQSNPPRTQGRRRRRAPRRRRCLLKGCERSFEPSCPQARYCSDRCRQEAARWRQWKARQRYRQTAGGRACRRTQSRRRRVQLVEKERRRKRAPMAPQRPRVGHHPTTNLHVTYTAPVPAIDPDVMRGSRRPSARRCNDFARTRAGARWRASSRANAGGAVEGRPTSAACATASVAAESKVLLDRGVRPTVHLEARRGSRRA